MFTRVDRFRLVILISICFILLLAVHLSLSGPRLVGKSLQEKSASTQLTLRFSSLLSSELPRIKVSPEVSFSSRINGSKLTIDFQEALRPDTSYSVLVSEVKDKRGRSSNKSVNFSTSARHFSYLQRGSEVDKVFIQQIGLDPVLLLETERIGDYGINSNKEVAYIIEESTREETFRSSFYVKHLETSTAFELPAGEPVEVVSSSSSENFIIKTQDTTDFKYRTFIFETDKQIFNEIFDIAGSSLHASEILFMADGKTILYQKADDNIVFIDDPYDNRSATALGSASHIARYLPDNNGIFVRTTVSDYELRDSDGDIKKFKLTSASEAQLLRDKETILMLREVYDLPFASQKVSLKTKEAQSDLFESSVNQSLIRHLQADQSDSFASFEYSSEPIVYDDYRLFSAPLESELKLINLRDGTIVHELKGSKLEWL